MDTFTRPVPRSKNLEGRTALITGASGGCGHAIAHYLAGAGSNICLHYNSQEPTILSKELSAYGVSVHSIQADLSSASECERLAGEAIKWSPSRGIDILVSNAGAGKLKNWLDVTTEEWDGLFGVNVRPAFILTKALYPFMEKQSWGRIIITSSIAGFNGGGVGPHYAATKAALHGFIYHIAPRVAKHGVTINGKPSDLTINTVATAPALVAGTKMFPGDQNKERMASIPVGRFCRTEEVAATTLLFAENGYITGKVFPIDGGLFPH